jgi:drug/metabolite transporter (DMT)-like permease
VAEALLSTSPLLSPLFALVLLRERVTWWNIAGILVSTAGMLMLVLAGSTDFQIGSPWGVPLAFAAVSTAVLYTIILRRIPSRYNALTIVFHIQAISLLFFWPLWGLKDAALQTDLWAAAGTTAQWWQSLGGVLYLAIFSSVAAFIMFCYTVRRLGVTRTNAFNNVRPVFTALFMFLFFAEQLPWGKLIGILLIVLGLFVSQRK